MVQCLSVIVGMCMYVHCSHYRTSLLPCSCRTRKELWPLVQALCQDVDQSVRSTIAHELHRVAGTLGWVRVPRILCSFYTVLCMYNIIIIQYYVYCVHFIQYYVCCVHFIQYYVYCVHFIQYYVRMYVQYYYTTFIYP